MLICLGMLCFGIAGVVGVYKKIPWVVNAFAVYLFVTVAIIWIFLIGVMIVIDDLEDPELDGIKYVIIFYMILKRK